MVVVLYVHHIGRSLRVSALIELVGSDTRTLLDLQYPHRLNSAVQAIDRLHDCLRQLAQRELPDGMYRDATGTVRVVMPVMDWEAFLHLAFDEIRLAGARSPQVTRRMVAALADLETVVPPERLPAVRRQHAAVLSEVASQVSDSEDVEFALQADRLGIGVAAGAVNRRVPDDVEHGR